MLGAILLVTTACNNGNAVGARPNNLPVQLGGQNNPHKAGGDGYTQFNTDRKPVQDSTGERASRSLEYLIAANTSADEAVLYPPSGEYKSAKSADSFFDTEQQQQLTNTRQNLDEGQPKTTGNAAPTGEVLQKAGQTFKDASGFLAKPGDDSYNRTGLE